MKHWIKVNRKENPTGGLDVCLLLVLVLSGRGLCGELLARPEESYRLWFVVVCDLETSWMRRSWLAGGRGAKRKNERRILITHVLLPVTSGLLHPELFVWIYTIHVNVKVKITEQHAGAGTEGLYVFSNSTLDDDGWSAPRPGHFTQGKKDTVPNVQETGWASGRLGGGGKSFLQRLSNSRPSSP